MNGLKPVRARRCDALTHVDWKQLEILLAAHYREQGYGVEHVGTGLTGAQSDGGIDLKLRREDEYVLVQVKHWNVYQVPHNDVHQLLGLTVNKGATGAILVTSGEFTAAAVAAATRLGHVQLVDGTKLREMLGPVLERMQEGMQESPAPVPAQAGQPIWRERDRAARPTDRDPHEAVNAFVRMAGERLLDAAEDRIRHGRRAPARSRSALRTGLTLLMLKLCIAAAMFGVLWLLLQSALHSMQAAVAPRPKPPVAAQAASDLPAPTGAPGLLTTAVEAPRPVYVAPPQPMREPTAAEIRESQRRADEAMRIIEATTPEM